MPRRSYDELAVVHGEPCATDTSGEIDGGREFGRVAQVMMQHLTQSSSGSGSRNNNNALPPPPTASAGKGDHQHGQQTHRSKSTATTTTAPSRLDVPSLDPSPNQPKSSLAHQSSSSPTTSSTFDFSVPRIAIFKEAFSFHSLRQRARLHKSPTPSTPAPPLAPAHASTPALGYLSSSSYAARQLSSTSLNSSSTLSRSLSLSSPTYTAESRSLSDIKLPSSKRPPASWSSHGIETSFGPPPALITRGSSYSSDLSRWAQNPAAATLAQQKNKPYNIKTPAKDAPALTKQDSFIKTDPYETAFDGASSPLSPKLDAPSLSHSLDAMTDRHSAANTTTNAYLEDGASACADGPSPVHDGPSGGDTEDSGRSAEDLFLKLAEDGPADTRQFDTQSRLERRMSRGRRPNQRQSLPANSEFASRPRRGSNSHDSGYATRSVVQASDVPVREQRRASATSMGFQGIPNRNPTSMTTDQRFNVYRNRYMTSTPQGSRRQSTADASRPSNYRPSRLNNNLDSASNTGSPLDQRQSSVADGAESVVSNAQSTVWDELHELKSRIHKMELNDMGGTMSNGSGERPRTATTTITTMSSSPKYPFKSGLSPTESVIGGPGAANIHPLLHQSLARCKQLLHPTLHRTLELAAADALEMVVLASNGSQGNMYSSASIVNGMMMDRQLRRKADNVCRNLTDLCIALCEGKLDLPATSFQGADSRRASQDITPSPLGNHELMNRTYSRQTSLEPEGIDYTRPSPSRALDRIEARRASFMSTRNGDTSPQVSDSHNTSNIKNTPSPQVIAKLPRTNTSLLRTRRRADPTEEDEEDQPIRPISRATTEIGSSVRRRSYRLSGGFLSNKVADREYTSQHPLPGSSPLAAQVPRRLNGASLKADSPRSPTTSSLLRGERRPDLRAESDAGANDDDRRAKRRSLGLYSGGGSARSSLGLGKRDSLSGKKGRGATVAAGGD